MRIALLHPTYWPEVRRGSERLIHDLGTMLAERGHEVTLLTSHPGPRAVAVEDGLRVVRSRRLPQPPTLGLHERFLGNAHNVVRELIRGRFDLAHAFYPTDAWAAVKSRRVGAPPVVFSLHGIPIRRYLVNRRYRLEMLQQTIAGAAASTVLSEAAAKPFRSFLMHDPVVLSGGVRADRFAVERDRSESPTIVCASSVADPRKRGRLLLSAFAALHASRPEARLLLVRTPDPEFGSESLELPDGAEWIEAGSTEELANAYASAWLTVLPAPDEAFGLVLLESLAAGTPVVAARSGGCPEIVDDDGIGRLFEADDETALSAALDEALELAGDPATKARCRERAGRYDWSRVIDRYTALYDEVGGRDSRFSVRSGGR